MSGLTGTPFTDGTLNLVRTFDAPWGTEEAMYAEGELRQPRVMSVSASPSCEALAEADPGADPVRRSDKINEREFCKASGARDDDFVGRSTGARAEREGNDAIGTRLRTGPT
jgi:hypothetical protein